MTHLCIHVCAVVEEVFYQLRLLLSNSYVQQRLAYTHQTTNMHTHTHTHAHAHKQILSDSRETEISKNRNKLVFLCPYANTNTPEKSPASLPLFSICVQILEGSNFSKFTPPSPLLSFRRLISLSHQIISFW
jgi:hypothetical protein